MLICVALCLIGASFYGYQCFINPNEKPGFCHQIFGLCYNRPTCSDNQILDGCQCTCNLTCQNGGTLDTDTCTCTCPAKFTGIDCSQAVQTCDKCNIQKDNTGAEVLCPRGFTTDESKIVAETAKTGANIVCTNGKCNRCIGSVFPKDDLEWASLPWGNPGEGTLNMMAYTNPGKTDQYCQGSDSCTYVSNFMPMTPHCIGCDTISPQ